MLRATRLAAERQPVTATSTHLCFSLDAVCFVLLSELDAQ